MSSERSTTRRRSGGGVSQVLLAVLAVGVLLAGGSFAYKVMQEHEAARASFIDLGHASRTTARADAKAFAKTIGIIGLRGAVGVEALGRPGGIARARDTLARSRQAYADYRTLLERRNTELRAKLRALPVSDSDRQKVTARMEASFRSQDADAKAFWDANEASLNEVGALIDDLERARGRWRPVNGMAAFSRQSDLDAFNRHVMALNELDARLERAQDRVNNSRIWVAFE